MSTAPDPQEPMPDGWKPKQWRAYVALHDGATRRDLALELEVGVSTIGGWVRKWRNEYGDELLVEQAEANRANVLESPGFLEAQRNAKTDQWTGLRTAIAHANGEAAGKALELVTTLLDEFLTDPERRAKLVGRDLYAISRAAEVLVRNADNLAGIPTANQQVRLEVQTSNAAAREATAVEGAVDLSGLDAREDDETAALGGIVIRITDHLDRFNSLEDDEIIDVVEAEA